MCNKPPDKMTTENPLLQLVSGSRNNNLIFYTQMNETWTRGGGNYCCICGLYELHIIPVDVRQQKSMCIYCFTCKLNQENIIKKMLKPYELTEQIFHSHLKKDLPPPPNLIPISQSIF